MENTLSKIDAILGGLRVHPEYSCNLAKKVLQNIREEADRHSSALEAEAGELTTREKQEFKSNSYKSLIEARDFLNRTGLSLYSFSCLGNILEPEKNLTKAFRSRSINFGAFEGATPFDIAFKIKDLLRVIEDSGVHPVKRAIEAHLSLVHIHPYFDGNGRAARLVQDVILQRSGYPPAVIPVTDRALYIRVLNKVHEDRHQHRSSFLDPSEAEQLFHNFVESKVLASSERLQEELNKKRVYNVQVYNSRSPGVSFQIKKNLKKLDRAAFIQIKRCPGNNVQGYFVQGNVGFEDLITELEDCKKRFDVRYKITPGEF